MKKITTSAIVMALFVLPMASLGAMYQYIDVNGDMRTIEAASATDALTMASLSGNMMASSGVMPAITTFFSGNSGMTVTSSGVFYGTSNNAGVGGDADSSSMNNMNDDSDMNIRTNVSSDSNSTITSSDTSRSDAIRTSTVSGNVHTTTGFINADGMIGLTNSNQIIRTSSDNGEDDFTMTIDASLMSGTIINENADEEMEELRNDEPSDDPDTMIDESATN